MRGVGRSVVVIGAAALALGISACTAPAKTMPGPTQTAWTEQVAPSGSASAGGSAVDAKGTAAQNRAAFDRTIEGVVAADAKASGQTVTAALEAAGFPKSSLQYSSSKTTAGLAVGSIMVSAQFGSSCLIGQWGSAVGGYHSAIAPALGSGGCLVGGGRLSDSTATGSLAD